MEQQEEKLAQESTACETDNVQGSEVCEAFTPEMAALAAQLEEAEKQRDEYLTLAQRVQADFDNFRRRNNAVRAEAYDDGSREMLTLMLPVLDNLERAVDAAKADATMQAGVELVWRQMREMLQKRGVEEIDCLGKPFDPELENAVMQGDASEGEPGTVCMVMQKGYKTNSRVLRHAMVKVVAG